MIVAQPVMPWEPPAPAPRSESTLPSTLEVTPVVGLHGIAWKGRRLMTLETGASAEWNNQVAAGITLLTGSAKGRRFLNEYNGQGVHVWTSARTRPDDTGKVSLGLLLDYVKDDIDIHAGDASTTQVDTWSTYASAGLRTDARVTRDAVSYFAQAGIYRVTLDSEHFADVGMLGVGASLPLGKQTQTSLQLSSFQDNYWGRHYAYEVHANVTYRVNDRSSVKLGGRYYPRGIPLAGTPLSSASTVGIIFGDEVIGDLRTRAFGSVTLAGSITF